MLSKFVSTTLDVAEQILLHHTFPEQELTTYCAKRKQRLRIERKKVETKERGYTYGVMLAMVNFAREGDLAIATQVGVEVAQEAMDLIFEEIECLRSEPIGEDELEMVRRIMLGEIMCILDGPFGVADVTIENILCGCENSAIAESVEIIWAYTTEQLQSLARQWLCREDLVCVVSGGLS